MSTAPKPFQRSIAAESRAALKELGSVGIAAGVAALWTGVLTHSGVFGFLTFAAVLGVSLRPIYRRIHGVAAYTINTSFNYIGLGKLNEASRLLDEAEAKPHFEWVRRLVDVQRAIIAMRRGDMAAARDRLDAAIARPIGLIEKANSLYQIEGAHALRAFARASLGDRDAALEDVRFVRSQPGASLDALAKVALAEALVLERAGERPRLKELLEREETLLLEHTHPRERAIVRGLQRMLRASSKASIYRQTAPSEGADDQEEPELADWVAKIAPDVAPFVRVPRRATDGSPAMIAASAAVAPRPDAVRAVAAAHAARVKPKRSAAWMWAPLVGFSAAFLGLLVWAIQGIQASSGSADAIEALFPATSSINPLVWIVPLIAFSIGSIAVIGAQQSKRARERRLSKSRAARRVDQPSSAATATPTLTALAMGPSDVAAAQARLILAGNAERSGDFKAVITECRLGIGRLENERSRAEADILYPDLIALAAFALAATGQSDEADAELALLSPMYPHHARAVFRVRLVQALRKNDVAGAALWVERGAADLPLSIREELLADIVRAIHAPSNAGAGEIERLKDELRRSPERRRWLDIVAPGVVSAFERGDEVDEREVQAAAAPRVRVDVRATESAGAATLSNAAEIEARAEAEADEASRPPDRKLHDRP